MGGSLRRRAKYLNSVLNHFWRRWSKEYLLELRDTHRHCNVNTHTTSVKPGDVVVVHDESYPRAFWKLARVKKLIIGKDELPRRAVFVKTPTKGWSTDYTSATSAADSPPGDLRKSTPS